jgi:Flp pilus assembly protein TadG
VIAALVRRLRDERGNSLVEFSWFAMLLMVPLVYLVLTVFQVQKAAYGVTAAARDAGRAYVTADAGQDAYRRAIAAGELSARDQGVDLTANQIRITPRRSPDCGPSGCVHVTVRTQVPLPFVPRLLFGRVPASVSVRADHEEVFDVYGDRADGEGPP